MIPTGTCCVPPTPSGSGAATSTKCYGSAPHSCESVIDTDPNMYLPKSVLRIRITLIWIRIRLFTLMLTDPVSFDVDPDKDPSFHADPDPRQYNPNLQYCPKDLHGSRMSLHCSIVSLHGFREPSRLPRAFIAQWEPPWLYCEPSQFYGEPPRKCYGSASR